MVVGSGIDLLGGDKATHGRGRRPQIDVNPA